MAKRPYQILNSNMLKTIAVITMLIDHTAVALIENHILGGPFHMNAYVIGTSSWLTMWWNVDKVMRYVGRLAFPIFCFQIVEGFCHTGDVKRYARRLFVFALISEIPFDLAVFNTWFYPQYQNVYFTLFLGLLAIAGIRKYEEEGDIIKIAATAAVCCCGAWLLKTDYGIFGVFFIILLYLYRNQTLIQTVAGGAVLLWEVTAPLAFIPIRMYNGARGSKKLKWFFYIFYPAHLLLLALIGMTFG